LQTEGTVPTNEAYGDPAVNGLLDTCGGHTGPGGTYHNHVLNATASCFPAGIVENVVGFAKDGFPIMTSTAGYRSGYVLKSGASGVSQVWSAYYYAPSADPLVLDECNGRALMGDPNYSYAYYVTSTFPYMLGCLRGESGSYVAATSSSTTVTGSGSTVAPVFGIVALLLAALL
jgi:hypothetical protein